MAEIKKVANSATVIRLGEVIGTFDMKETSVEQLSEAMVGRKVVETKNDYSPRSEEVVLKIENLTMKKVSNTKVIGLENFSLDVHAGEVVAIAGVEGNGQQEIAEAITGMSKVYSGNVKIHNHDITYASIASRYSKWKISHVPEDRHKHGLVLDFSVSQNVVLQDIDNPKFSQAKIINSGAVQAYAQTIIQKFDVRNADAGFAIARQLSGGNQQKVILGREITRPTDLLVIYQPTRGLDVGSIEFIHAQILKAKKDNRAILLISYELSEVLALADRIVVLNAGKKIGELPGKGAKREEVGKMMLGRED
nr:ATP-binding cassette domain-containing protein [Spiroplasma clarkii]